MNLLAPGSFFSSSAFSSVVEEQMSAVVGHVAENDLRGTADMLAAGENHQVAAFDQVGADVA